MNALSPGNRVMLAQWSVRHGRVGRGRSRLCSEISPGAELTVLKQAIQQDRHRADDEDSVDEHDELDEEEAVTADRDDRGATPEPARATASVRSRSRRRQPLRACR